MMVKVVAAVSSACAGTTDVSPNPSEATATTATFFNEIVFTIFLSFSQIKDDLLSGW
jgi:glycerol uptake facilitator-like aquaporin